MNQHRHLAGSTHLRVLGCDPVGDPTYCDYRWNNDYTAYRVCPLLWWDDASYAAYQSDDCYGDEEQDEPEGGNSAWTTTPMPAFDLDAVASPNDDLCF